MGENNAGRGRKVDEDVDKFAEIIRVDADSEAGVARGSLGHEDGDGVKRVFGRIWVKSGDREERKDGLGKSGVHGNCRF